MIHVALRVAFRSVPRPIINLNRTGEDAGEIRIGRGDIAAGIYVDNLIVVGSNSDQVGKTHAAMVAALNAANLRCGADSIIGPTDVVDYVGLEIRGDTREIFPKGSRVAHLVRAARFLATCHRWNVRVIERLLGYVAWVFCVRRPLLVVLGALYQYVRQFRGQSGWAAAWPSAQREMRAIARLAPLAVASLARSWAPIEFAQDAEGPNRTDHGGPAPHCGLGPGVPDSCAAQWLGSQQWEPLLFRRWQYSEHVNLGEMHAVLLWLQRAARCPAWFGRRVLLWTDSGVVLGVLRKGRARSFALCSRYRKLAAHLLAADLDLDARWCPSALQPGDGISRLRPAYVF